MSGSVALLADTIHNFSDALTAVPLWIAFVHRYARGDPPLHLRLPVTGCCTRSGG
jgi:Co/Zn/Cd efflux system component